MLTGCYPDSEAALGRNPGGRSDIRDAGRLSETGIDDGQSVGDATSDSGAEDGGQIVIFDTTPEPADDWPAEWIAFEDQVLSLVNQRRAAGATCGGDRFAATGPLVMNAELRQAARLHGEDMAARGYFDHVAPDGSDPFERIEAAGYQGGFPQGENIAAGYRDASSVVSGWMSSPGHCSNIMEPAFGAMGVGFVFSESSRDSPFWVQTFGRRP